MLHVLARWRRQVQATWHTLPERSRLVAGTGLALAVMGLLRAVIHVPEPCTTRADVEARVAGVTAALQAEAAAGRMGIADLALAIRDINAASTAWSANARHQDFCRTLERLRPRR